jgi:hypothetical protein
VPFDTVPYVDRRTSLAVEQRDRATLKVLGIAARRASPDKLRSSDSSSRPMSIGGSCEIPAAIIADVTSPESPSRAIATVPLGAITPLWQTEPGASLSRPRTCEHDAAHFLAHCSGPSRDGHGPCLDRSQSPRAHSCKSNSRNQQPGRNTLQDHPLGMGFVHWNRNDSPL